jgi:transcriptional regulator with XRE-family HTH domain
MDVSLSELVAIYRKRLNLSQAELAKRAGVSRNYISLIERGHIENVTLHVYQSVCRELGFDIQFNIVEKERNE